MKGRTVENNRMVYPNKTIATVSPNINALNISIKRQRMSEWILNSIHQLCYIQEMHFIFYFLAVF